MYEPDTILKLKKPRKPDPDSKQDFPYNRVRVVGVSPISHGSSYGGQWEGTNAQGVIVEPLSSFASNIDEPFGKLRSLYDVESVPDRTIPAPTIRVINTATADAGPTPEEVFEEQAPGPPNPSGKRVRTPFQSPLDDPRPKSTSPLAED